jgi:hypothetical protein
VIEQAMNATRQLDGLINAFGTLVQVCCRLAEDKKAARKKRLARR